ncbi:uncharacterized protein LOC120258663 [Dioscorea cayenensis subsp. rotundata]|uniref:Uncharacterized protein LOC120258663 n=1 Tax=Dioscorea cayennensis subsp. rotundata TaxID=55577 RepID=A0AB40B453_DIOCR|nr:uncharacterized protein LOC120258663 [Dioscorea cayenensis subsp. rotundata]
MVETSLVLVYYNCSITASEETIIFLSEDQSYFYVEDDISYENLQRSIEESIETADNQGVLCIKYRLTISLGSGKIYYWSFKFRNDQDVRMMFDCHKRNPDIGIIELYVEFSAAAFEGAPSQQQTALDNERNMRRERISSACQVNEPEWLSTEWRALDDPPPNIYFTNLQHLQGGTSSFHDTHETEFGQYGRSSGDDEDDGGDSFGEDTEASIDDIQLEKYNLEDVPMPGHNFTMAPMEPPTHMRALDLEAMSAQEFREYPLLYADTLSGATTDGDLHVGMRFRRKDDAVTAIKHYCLLKSVEYKVIEPDPTRFSGKYKSYGDGCNWRVHTSYSKQRQLWEITKYIGFHTCSSAMISQDHSKLDSNKICCQIQALVQQQPSINVLVLIAKIKNRYGYIPTHRKVWTAKQKAVEAAFGNWENSYNELPRWLLALQQFVVGTIVDLETQPA